MAKNIREKTARIAENKDRRPRAIAKHVRISPYKVRVVLDIIRGKSYTQAVAILENTPKSASDPIKNHLQIYYLDMPNQQFLVLFYYK